MAKRTRKVLNAAPALPRDPWRLGDEDWHKLIEAYGPELTGHPDIRQLLEGFVRRTLERDRGWKSTPSSAELKKGYEALARPLHKFAQTLERLKRGPKGVGFHEVLSEDFQETDMEDLSARIEHLAFILRQKAGMEKSLKSFEPNTWDDLIRSVVKLFREKGLSTNLGSADRSGQKNSSPMLKLLIELNRLLPAELRRRRPNDQAMEAAVRRAIAV